MYAVGRLGSYISRGVYTVSGPFHPFGGAVDIIVVEQQDGSYKSSPWYVRFGKFQGVLKTKEKVVSISIDGVEANFHMLLNHKGEAYFLREVDGGEEEESALYPLSSGEEADGQSPDDRRPLKTQSFNLDVVESSPEDKIDKKVVTRSKSSQSRFLGLFGRKEVKDETFYEKEEGDASVARVSSMERAEIAADLLELQWSTSLSTMKKNKGNVSNLSSIGKLDGEAGKDLQIKDEQGLDQVVLLEETGSGNKQIHSSSESDSEKLKCSAEEASADISCLSTHEKVVETSMAVLEGKCEIVPITSRVADETCVDNADHDGVANGSFSEITGPNSRVSTETRVGNADHDGIANGALSEITGPNPRVSTETRVGNADHDGIANGALSEITGPDSRVSTETCIGTAHPYPDDSDITCPNLHLAYSIEFEASPSLKFPVEQVSNRREFSLHCEMSDTSIVGLDGSGKRTSETQYPANGGRGEVYINTEIPTKDTRTEHLAGDARLETELAQLTVNNCHQKNSSCYCMPDHNEMDLKELSTVTDTYTPILGLDSNNGSVDEVQSLGVGTISTSRDSGQQVEGEKKVVDEGSLQSELASRDNSKKISGDSISTDVASVATSQSSEEEQFLIGDLDEYKLDGVQTVEPVSPDHLDKENHCSISLEGTEAGHNSISPRYKAYSSSDKFVRENPSIYTENSVGTSRVSSIPISISRTPKAPGDQVGQLGESMPNMWFQIDDLDNHMSASLPLSHSLDANSKSLKWTLLGKDDSCVDPNIQREEQLAKEQLNSEYTQIPGELNSTSASPQAGVPSPGGEQESESEGTMAVDGDGKPNDGDPSKPTLVSNGSWKLWPFSFRRTRSGKAKQPAPGEARFPEDENATESTESTDGTWEKTNELRPKRFKKIFRANTPTSEELSSLKLREGRNTITFTFKTGMLGNQQVDARIYLWKWNTRIVISDVDGTITKSDVLGQFMPMVGIDWCQIGVAHLFSAIKENGYQLLFLSARAIAQAYHTRQFLLNIKQDGKALPDGPIVISPDGLFPSLYREVIRRAPHEFKIACLEDIKALFPHDCNPFYAGFGNRDTDEVSYLKVGIPRGKIFIINPKGQVAVSRRVATKSYTCLHDLVHDMFPPTATEQEDFNSWNFWKLPPPSIDM